jgi:hypothetical protein
MSRAFEQSVPGDSARNVRSFIWRYLLPTQGSALYLGPSSHVAEALHTQYKSVAWVHDGHSLDAGVGKTGRFDALITDWPEAIRLLGSLRVDDGMRRLAGLVSDVGVLVIRFERRAVYERLWPQQGLSAQRLTDAAVTAGFSEVGLFWFRDGFTPEALYGVTRLGETRRPPSEISSPLAWHLRRRSLALVARRRRFEASECPALDAGFLTTRARTEPVASAWFGSGSVHRVETDETIVRIPFDVRAVDRCRNNHATLHTLAGFRLSFAIPQAQDVLAYGGLPCFAESRVPGHSTDVRAMNPRSSHVRVDSVTKALIELQRATRLAVTIDERWLAELIRTPCARLSPSLPPDLRLALSDVEAKTCSILKGRSFSLVQLHGDFKGSNLLWSEDERVSAVVDWDLAVRHYLPVIDFVFYMAYEHAAKNQTAFDGALADEVEPKPSCAYWQFVERELGLTKTTYAICLLMALVRYATHHAGFLDPSEHPEWCVRHVNNGLGRVVEYISRIQSSSTSS